MATYCIRETTNRYDDLFPSLGQLFDVLFHNGAKHVLVEGWELCPTITAVYDKEDCDEIQALTIGYCLMGWCLDEWHENGRYSDTVIKEHLNFALEGLSGPANAFGYLMASREEGPNEKPLTPDFWKDISNDRVKRESVNMFRLDYLSDSPLSIFRRGYLKRPHI